MSVISGISTGTLIALGVGGIGAGIGAKVAHDRGHNWAIGALVGGLAGFGSAKLVQFGISKLGTGAVSTAAQGAAGLGHAPAPAAATAVRTASTAAATGSAVGGNAQIADELMRTLVQMRSAGAGAVSTAAPHVSIDVARMFASYAAPVATATVTSTAALLPRVTAPTTGGGLTSILRNFVTAAA